MQQIKRVWFVSDSNRELVAGSLWMHYKGGLYVVYSLPLDEQNVECVTYQRLSDNACFVCSAERFLELVSDGYRFTKLCFGEEDGAIEIDG